MPRQKNPENSMHVAACAGPKPFTDQWNPSRADKMIVPDTSDSPYRPFILWFETLPSGDTAQISLLPRPTSRGVVGQWNGQAVRTETCATEAEAERLAWEWWNELPNLMGIGPDDLAEVSMPWA